jgi:hypothetical protein
MSDVPPYKDENASHPVATAWRAPLRAIVHALAEGDYALDGGVNSVAPVSAGVADQMRSHIADYGETLVELPDDAWESSVSQWMRSHWDVLVDLWTVESGASDLVLCVRIFEDGVGFRIEVDSIRVP